MENIVLSPMEVWAYAKDHRSELEAQGKRIAFDPETNTEIQIAVDAGMLMIFVYRNGQEEYYEELLNCIDAAETVGRMYTTYIYGAKQPGPTSKPEIDSKPAADVEPEPEEPESDEIESDEPELDEEAEDLIEERELELDDAAYDFLLVACGESLSISSRETQEILEDIKDTVLPMLYKKHGIETYRPMYLIDDDGNEELSLYPYAEIL